MLSLANLVAWPGIFAKREYPPVKLTPLTVLVLVKSPPPLKFAPQAIIAKLAPFFYIYLLIWKYSAVPRIVLVKLAGADFTGRVG